MVRRRSAPASPGPPDVGSRAHPRGPRSVGTRRPRGRRADRAEGGLPGGGPGRRGASRRAGGASPWSASSGSVRPTASSARPSPASTSPPPRTCWASGGWSTRSMCGRPTVSTPGASRADRGGAARRHGGGHRRDGSRRGNGRRGGRPGDLHHGAAGLRRGGTPGRLLRHLEHLQRAGRPASARGRTAPRGRSHPAAGPRRRPGRGGLDRAGVRCAGAARRRGTGRRDPHPAQGHRHRGPHDVPGHRVSDRPGRPGRGSGGDGGRGRAPGVVRGPGDTDGGPAHRRTGAQRVGTARATRPAGWSSRRGPH